MNLKIMKSPRSLLVGLFFCSSLSAQVPNAQTLHEAGQQYKEGNPLVGASDNLAIGSEAMFQANLKAKKNIVDMKPNTFLSIWNNPGFAVQFEKYLSAPAETSDDAKTYRERISRIMELLSPGNATKKNQDEAFNLLTKASEFESDANICSTIHDAVYTAANVRTEIARLIQQNGDLERQRKIAEYNNLQAARARPLDQFTVGKNEAQNYNKNQDIEREARMDPTKRELASLGQTIERNKTRIATAESRAKMQFQTLILQLFVQRRYQHVIIANRFYRAIFDDGDQLIQGFEQMADKLGYNKEAGQLKVIAKGDPKGAAAAGGDGGRMGAGTSAGTGGAAASVGNNNSGMDGMALSGSGVQFGLENASVESLMNAVSSGMRTLSKTFKTLSQLDGVANEIIRDVNEGVKVYKYLLEKEELESAATQLASLFTKGEYLPSVRLLTQDEKRKTLAYAQLCNRLVNAANSGNIDVLTDVVDRMKKMNPSFDDAEIHAKLEGVKTASRLLVAQARVAAARGDLQSVQTQITRAAALWPNNPDITNFSADMGRVSEKASPQVQALSDFDQLYGQKNYRAIYDGIDRFGVAVAADDSTKAANRKAMIQEVRNRMIEVEKAIMKAQEVDRRGDHAGAWEGLEIAFEKYPDDPKLTQMRADLTTQAPDFVHDIRQAKALEERRDYGSSLAWYLRSQSRYPMSDLSKQGIQRVVKQILPDAN